MGFGFSINDLAIEIEETGWSRKIETGVEVLDDQHRQYFSLVNDYLTTAAKVTTNDKKHKELVERLNFLRRYAIEHFETEQKIMEETGYPGYQQHLKEHEYFMMHVGELYQQTCDKQQSDKLTREVYFYTLEWFIGHIQFTDMKMVEFLKQNTS